MEIYKITLFKRCEDEEDISNFEFEICHEYKCEHVSYDKVIDTRTVNAALKVLEALYDEDANDELDYSSRNAILQIAFPRLSEELRDYILVRLADDYLTLDKEGRENFLNPSAVTLKEVKYDDIKECLNINEVLISLGFVRNEETYWELVDSPSGTCFRYYVDTDKLYELYDPNPEKDAVLSGPLTLGSLVDRIFS